MQGFQERRDGTTNHLTRLTGHRSIRHFLLRGGELLLRRVDLVLGEQAMSGHDVPGSASGGEFAMHQRL